MLHDGAETNTTSRHPGGARSWRFSAAVWKIVRILLIAYLLVVVFAMFFEESLIYFPFPFSDKNARPGDLEFENARFQAADGTRLHGWYIPKENARAAILFCHGNGGNITHRYDKLKMLHDRAGVSVLIFDYRGYGRSEGKPSEAGVLQDARAARAWLAQRENIAEKDVVLMGESLGGAVAVDLAARDGARALVLDSTFSSMPDVAAFHYPFLPVRWAMRTRFDSLSKIGDYHGPLFQAHGDADTIVPMRFGRRLFEAANEPKQWITLLGHDHNDPLPEVFYDRLADFLKSIPCEGKK